MSTPSASATAAAAAATRSAASAAAPPPATAADGKANGTAAVSAAGAAPPAPVKADGDPKALYAAALAFNREREAKRKARADPTADSAASAGADAGAADADDLDSYAVLVCSLRPLPPVYTRLVVRRTELMAAVNDRIADWLRTAHGQSALRSISGTIGGKPYDAMVTFGYVCDKILTGPSDRTVPSIVVSNFTNK